MFYWNFIRGYQVSSYKVFYHHLKRLFSLRLKFLLSFVECISKTYNEGQHKMVGCFSFALREEVTYRGKLMWLEVTKRKMFSLLINYLRNRNLAVWIWPKSCAIWKTIKYTLGNSRNILGYERRWILSKKSNSSVFFLLLNSWLYNYVDMNLPVFHYAVINSTFPSLDFCCRKF